MFSQRILGLSAVLLVGCATNSNVRSEPADAGLSEEAARAAKLDSLEQQATALLHAEDEALWAHWTAGAPLDFALVKQPYRSLLSRESLTLSRERVDLHRFIASELISEGVAVEQSALSQQEATVTFTLDGKELAWRDLPRLLASEKSAVKRRALWTASHEAAKKLEEALGARDAKRAQVIAELGLAPDFEEQARGVSLANLRVEAEALLNATDAEWFATLQKLSDAEVKLPLTALTRGDFPRLLRVPANVDAEFPKEKFTTRLPTVASVTIDAAESPKKSALPLTVALSPTDVRVSIKPGNGLRDAQQALAEVGLAKALVGRPRLGDMRGAQVQAQLAADSVRDDAWLAVAGVESREAVIASARALWLFQARRAAAVVLSVSPEKYVMVMGRALGLKLNADEAARYRVETSDVLRAASQLDTILRAEEQRQSH
jgi:hypothetical protein